MSGFNNPIIGGSGALVYPSIHSPGYPAIPSWSLNKDGSASFSGSVTSGGTVSGANITFANGFLSNGDSTYTNQPGLFMYSGTPAAGNLTFSDAVNSGTDKFGNNFIGNGPVNYNNGSGIALGTVNGVFISWYSMTAQPGATFTALGNLSMATTPNGNGVKAHVGSDGFFLEDANTNGLNIFHAAANSVPQVDIGDGNLYTYGQKQFSAQAIGVPSNVTFTGFLTFPVESGITYDLYARILYAGNQNAGAPIIGWHGGSLGASLPAGYGYTHFNWVQNAVYNNAVAGDRTGPALTTSPLIYETRHRFAATGTGTLGIAGACSVAGDTWNMLACDLTLRPIR